MTDGAPRNHKPSLMLFIPAFTGGGAERVASNLLSFLEKHFDIVLVLVENRRTYPVPGNVRVEALSGSLGGLTAHILRIPLHILSLVRLVRRYRADVVLSILEQANIINIFASRIIPYKVVISQHIEPRRQYGSKGVLGKIIFSASRILYRKAHHVISVSRGIKDVLLRDYCLRPDAVTVIYNPIDGRFFSTYSADPPLFELPERFLLHVGRLRLAAKAQDVLLEAFRKVSKRHPGLALVLVGEGEDRRKIEDMVKEYDLERSVIFAGWQENVAALMNRAEIVVLPSRYEGFPMVLVEALAMGCPVVGADCPTGPREILGDDEYGLLVPVEDPDSLAAAVERLLEDESLRAHYSRRALERADDFDLEKIGNQYKRVLNRVMAKQAE
ncbi:MAG TPA: glycosyltransferase [Thermodesulfobacteriaceae bacterium]|nr:glycosyltransferase [Thermodesulfobacteriaceae bacterium]